MKNLITTGFRRIDVIVKHLREGGTYLVGGLEKSGKSAFTINVLIENLKKGMVVGFVDTELTRDEFFQKLAALHKNKRIDQVTDDDIDETKAEYKNLYYTDIQELSNDYGVINFEKAYFKVKQFVEKGAKLIIFDNLTVFNSQKADSSWQDIANAATRLINLTKKQRITTILVLHLNKGVTYVETPSGIRKLIEENTPEKIFQESLTIVRKPTLSDTYGGGGFQLQLSGSFLIWRPFQKFGHPGINKLSAVILESFRHCKSGDQIEMEFIGDKAKFIEIDIDVVSEAEKIFNL